MPTSQLIPQGFACALLLSPSLGCGPSYRQQTHQAHTAESTQHQVATHTHFSHAQDSLELEVSEELRFIPLPSDSLPPTPLRSLLPQEKGWSLTTTAGRSHGTKAPETKLPTSDSKRR